MAVVAGDIIDLGRGLLATLASLSGVRATGQVQVRTSSGNPGSLLIGNYLLPIVNGQLRQDLVFKVPPNADKSTSVTVPGGAGGAVNIVSNLGGVRHNLPAGTKFLFDPPLPGIEPDAELLPSGTAGGVDPSGLLAIREGVLIETLAGPLTGMEFFRSTLKGMFPAVVLQWLDSEPADGLATSTLARGNSRAGEGSQLYAEEWMLTLIVSKAESEPVRRAQGLRLLGEVTGLITDRQSIDGVVISHPSGAQIRRRGVLSGLPRDVYQAYQIYQVELAVTGNYERSDSRTYADLLRFKLDAPKHDQSPSVEGGPDRPNLPVVHDVLIENPQDP